MDRWKLLDVLHREHLFCNPLSEAKVDEIVGLARLRGGARVLDLGCGKGEILCRFAERWGADGVGVDLSPFCVSDARARVAERGLAGRIRIVEGDGASIDLPAGGFDAALCLGASWIFGGYAGTLAALARFVTPGGWVIAGEPFWAREPSPEHLRAAKLEPGAWSTHRENMLIGVREGLVFLHALASSPDDWDRYEGYHRYSVERYAAEHPDDPDVGELLAAVRDYSGDLYLRFGRDEIGWGVYLFSKPRG
jgi:SAM-dependent methyltransferase